MSFVEERAMGYLQPAEYGAFGLGADTSDDLVATASTLIDSHCRRTSLNATQYVERMRLNADSQTVRLSYLPLLAVAPAATALVSVRARYGRPRRGEMVDPFLEQAAWAFSLPGSWTSLDVTTIDSVADTGELTLTRNVMGIAYNEVEVTYTAGFATVPDAVKVACAQIVRNAQATPALNVRMNRIDTMQVQYFSDSLIDGQVASLLAPYRAARLG
jgi:hypothetical protein